jgi:CBS domain-containing protein
MVDESASIRQVAQAMSAAGYTIALVMNQGALTGIVTDRAYCTKVAARDLSLDAPVTEIMTKKPMTITVDSRGSDALLIMARHNIRHLPVLDQQRLIGVVTATDLIREQSHNAIYLINEIHRAKDENELKLLSLQLPDALMVLVGNSLTAYDIGHAISSIGRAITRRLLHFAEARLGAAPVGYAWIVAGSMARDEQMACSDQDNALMLSDDYDEKQHGDYFEKLSRIVCDGLNNCGYIYCPGDVMATNKQWRQPLSVWLGYFRKWIDQPEPMALMYASIFFDLACVHGDSALLEKVQAMVLEKTRSNSIFLGHMANNALKYQPPLGLFRNFVLEKTGREAKALDLKKRGTVPVIDLARVYALSAGLPAINTQDRLEAACEAGVLSREGMEDLRDTLEFISSVRLKHQAAQVKQNEETDNYVSPEKLTSLERRHLKDAFDVVRTIQSVMEQRYKM